MVGTWFLLIGSLFLAMAFTSDLIRRLPVTNSIVYLVVGIIVGPTVFHAIHFNPLTESALLQRVTELAVLLSLFTAGVKMPVPVTVARWRLPVLLAVVGMIVTVVAMTAFGYYALGLPLGAAVLLAGILAPTDPVLATDVQVRHPGDHDRLRFGLTCEAGINDGTAYPVVMLGLGLLGLHQLGDGWRWLTVDVIWATIAGIGFGIACGYFLARIIWYLRERGSIDRPLDDFLGLGLIGLVYGGSLLVEAGGFLAVFFAAVALRQTEFWLAGRRPDPYRLQTAVPKSGRRRAVPTPTGVTGRALAFKEKLERLSEVVLILIVGGTLFLDSWSWRAVGAAVFLFLIARPLATALACLGTRAPWRHRVMAGWFGVRGIGSLYYLMFAIQSGLPEELALELIHIVLIVVTLSILAHGISVKPAMARYARPQHLRSWQHGREPPLKKLSE